MDTNSKYSRWEAPALAIFLLVVTLCAYDFGESTPNGAENAGHERVLKKLKYHDPEEDNQIEIFHNVAPSVVFIDTFKEVQIVSGSGDDNDKKEKEGGDKKSWNKKNEKWSKNADNGKQRQLNNMDVLRDQWRKKQDRLRKLGKGKEQKHKEDIKVVNSIEMPKGAGTGFVWDKEGHIITNSHVVNEASVVEVSLLTKKDVSDENAKLFPTSLLGRNPGIDEYHWRVVKAKVIGSDPASDIAVIKIDAPKFDLHPIEKGDEKDTMVGADCLAIGNPFGLDHTLSRGIISAKGRVAHSETGVPITNLIQTDASINPGNSGGPLLNSNGQVIGMNSMGMTSSGSSSGVGFAIPISTISNIADILIRKGRIVRPNFGVMFDMGYSIV